ncbi:hypothetical protein PMAYCL1PPCAC_13176, partial [Pristionchus mayeri]
MAIVGSFSVFISLILIYLIICKTPYASRQYRRGLILLQICFLVFDVHWCFLFVPLISLPYFGIYSSGFLCTTIKMDIHYQMVFMLFFTIETFAWFFICMLQRHQVNPLQNTQIISVQALSRTLSVCSTIFAASGPIGFSTCRLTQKEIDWTLEVYLMRWLESKPQYIVYSKLLRPEIQVYLGLFLISMLLFSVACISLTVHSMHVIRRSMMNSGKSKDLKSSAMRNLFIQFAVFAAFLLLPGFLLIFNVWVKFDIEIFVSCQILFASHSLASSLVALFVNSTYRRHLKFWKKKSEIKILPSPSRKTTTVTMITVSSLS